jgi:hypothetical protein
MTRLFGLAIALSLLTSIAGFVGTASAQPSWAAPGECFLDDGYNRYRTCSGGGTD